MHHIPAPGYFVSGGHDPKKTQPLPTMRTIISLAASLLASALSAQALLEPPDKTVKVSKEKVNCIHISPRGDQAIVGTSDGADLIDINTGKLVHHFKFMEDQQSEVWHAQFNDNGEWVMLAGFTGKRQVWNLSLIHIYSAI